MIGTYPKCIRCVDSDCTVKNGKTTKGTQRYLCRRCNRTFVEDYTYSACKPVIEYKVIALVKEGCGIRSIARLLGISTNAVARKIQKTSHSISKPSIPIGKEYELDELCTYIGYKKNRIWVAHALRKDTREVVNFVIGRRTNKTLKRIIDTLLFSHARRIYTDKLRNYQSLVPKAIHCTWQYRTNRIERMNLTLRTHLKRLSRKTICYSKSIAMLQACLTIYFWG